MNHFTVNPLGQYPFNYLCLIKYTSLSIKTASGGHVMTA